MDFNPSDLKTSEHMIIWSHPKNLVETKSFKCTFCKRGFTNAQALGGHMNIHRRDRAKLKELSSDDDRPPPDSSSSKRLSSENEEIPNRGLPLLMEEAAAVNDGEEAERCRLDKDVELNYGELDLELRLGPEPHHVKSKP
ncbi:hypothetical protein ACS0TY_015685 [Phlomoides rotata]